MRKCSLAPYIIYLLLGLTCQEVFASQKEKKLVHMAFVDHKRPFSSSSHSGIEIDLAKAAFAAVDIKLATHFFANDKLKHALTNRRVDAIVTATNPDNKFYESDLFISYHNLAISKKRSQITLNSLQDITQYHSAAWRNAHIHLGKEFGQLFKPLLDQHADNYLEMENQLSQCRMFWLDRIDIIIIDKSIFNWCKLQLSEINTQEAVVIHDLFKFPNEYPVLFRSKPLRDQFNLGLKAIRENGQYQQILNKHLTPDRKYLP